MMKTMTRSTFSALVFLLIGIAVYGQANPLAGSWQYKNQSTEHIAVFIDGYFTHSEFDKQNKQFIRTRGGTFTQQGNQLKVTWQFDSKRAADDAPNAEWIGQTETFQVQPGNTLQSNITGSSVQWTKVGDHNAPLAGVWRMSGRKVDGNISNSPLGDRRTLKILTGNRFQWAAINIKTGEFSGTGGGTYTFKDGTYTENIEFFSRDNTRVGASLAFNGEIKEGQWHHSGNSSTGNPIYEVWIKIERHH
jgi:hypothetical protein